jgi:hypothetical protein
VAASNRLFLGPLLRRFFGLTVDNSFNRPVQARTLLYQLIESEISAADAFLDLGDLGGCDHNLSRATHHREQLRGPENMLMNDRVGRLKEKRSAYPYLNRGE